MTDRETLAIQIEDLIEQVQLDNETQIRIHSQMIEERFTQASSRTTVRYKGEEPLVVEFPDREVFQQARVSFNQFRWHALPEQKQAAITELREAVHILVGFQLLVRNGLVTYEGELLQNEIGKALPIG